MPSSLITKKFSSLFIVGALLQTFPKDYDFGEEIKTVAVSRHIGNAVPPKLGLVIGEKIVEHIEENYVR
jgi:DNA (cytosine-5)-methyltransferase 1